MPIIIFKCSPKCSLYEYWNYCRINVCAMFSARWITPDALYRCYSSFTRNSGTLYSKLFIPFLIKFDFFTTINTHIEGLCSIQDKTVLYQPEGRGFGALCSE
jgi:hypothetical protein